MARLFADENCPLPAVEALRRRGHDVLTIYEAGQAQQSTPDDIVLKTATADGRAIITLNRKHFVHLHSKQPSHAGIIICTFDPDFEGQAQRIHDAPAIAPSTRRSISSGESSSYVAGYGTTLCSVVW